MSCELGASCTCRNEEKPYCKNWTPGRGSKYFRCARFISTRATCPLDKSACKTCEHFIQEMPKREPAIDWSDKDAVKAYRSEYMRRYREFLKKRAERKNKDNQSGR